MHKQSGFDGRDKTVSTTRVIHIITRKMSNDTTNKMDLDEQPAAKVPVVAVKTLTDRKIIVDIIDGINTVGDLRKVIANKEGPEVAAHRLVFKGRVLEDAIALRQLFPEMPIDEDPTRLSNILHLFYYEPQALSADPIDIATDWDSKNRLKVFKGAFALSRRDFATAADLLTDSLPTFAELSFIEYRDCVRYAVIAGTLMFDRPVLYKRIVRSPEVLECIQDIGPFDRLVTALYNCQYADFFKALAEAEQWLKQDWLLAPHTAYLVKELRVKAYKQLMTAYRSLKLSVMAAAFGVSADFIDNELSRFIAAGRLNCTINRVAGVVESVPVDLKHAQYKLLIKESDALAARIQRLSRMVSY